MSGCFSSHPPPSPLSVVVSSPVAVCALQTASCCPLLVIAAPSVRSEVFVSASSPPMCVAAPPRSSAAPQRSGSVSKPIGTRSKSLNPGAARRRRCIRLRRPSPPAPHPMQMAPAQHPARHARQPQPGPRPLQRRTPSRRTGCPRPPGQHSVAWLGAADASDNGARVNACPQPIAAPTARAARR